MTLITISNFSWNELSKRNSTCRSSRCCRTNEISSRITTITTTVVMVVCVVMMFGSWSSTTTATAFAMQGTIQSLLLKSSVRPIQQQHQQNNRKSSSSDRRRLLLSTSSLELFQTLDLSKATTRSSAIILQLRGGAMSDVTVGNSFQVLERLQQFVSSTVGIQTPQSLFNTIFSSLVVLILCIKAAQRISNHQYNNSKNNIQQQQKQIKKKPAHVKSLQIRFLSVFWLLRCSDWLQGPYFYDVYASKVLCNSNVPVSISLISRLFLTGFASTALFGPILGKISDQYGRKKATIAFTVIYSLGALSTKSNIIQLLFLGRILSGIGTSLLFSAPESWLVGESQQQKQQQPRSVHENQKNNSTKNNKNRFEKEEEEQYNTDSMEYLGETFGLAYSGDSIVAIGAGQMAGIAAQHRGPTGPFELSTVFLTLGGILTALLWNENKGAEQQKQQQQKQQEQATKQSELELESETTTKVSTSSRTGTTTTTMMSEAMTICKNDPKIILVGTVQALFEAAMYIFVLQWPPIMSKAIELFYSSSSTTTSILYKPPYGTIFSCFMACCLLGSTIFGQVTTFMKNTQTNNNNDIATTTTKTTQSIITIEQFTTYFLALSSVAMFVSTGTIMKQSHIHPTLSLPFLTISFFVFETVVGMYFPSIGTLRSQYIPDSHRSLIMNLFGIPLNVLVVSVFLSLHKLGTSGALLISSGSLLAATGCMIQLQRYIQKEKNNNQRNEVPIPVS